MSNTATVIYEIEKNGRERVRVALDHFKGHNLVDVRVTAQLGQTDAYTSTAKGISLRIEKLPELIAALQAAAAEAVEQGFLPARAVRTNP